MFPSQPAPTTSAGLTGDICRASSQGSGWTCEFCSRHFKSKHGLKIHKGRAHKADRVERAAGIASADAVEVSSSGVASAAAAEAAPSLSVEEVPLWKVLSDLRRSTPVLRRIPRGARHSVASALKACMDRVVTKNSVEVWRELLTFSYRILYANAEGRGVSLTQRIKDNCQCPGNRAIVSPNTETSPRSGRGFNIFKKVESKVSEGDLGGASQLLFSTDALAPNNKETLDALIAKHPEAPTEDILPEPPPNLTPPQVSLDRLLEVIMSFKNGSGGGLDGLTPQHLKDLVCVSSGDSGRALLTSLASLVELMLSGRVCDNVVDTLYGASLCALSKKDGGIRPIALGTTLRRIAAKISCRSITPSLAQLFQPFQMGCGSRGGCEAAVHATRAFLETRQDGLVLKVDVRNAFNTINRSWLLTQAKTHVPSLLPFLLQCYGKPSNLVYQDHLLKSGVGCQQGDPLGPALFSLGIHPHITSLRSILNVWYLDDGTLGGDAETVLADLRDIESNFKAIGLSLNFAKCELYIPPSKSVDERQQILAQFDAVAPGITLVTGESLQLLGAPLMDESVPAVMNKHIKGFRETSDRLRHINAHMALTLIRFCLFVPKFNYLLRCSQLWKFESVMVEVDSCISDILSKVLNVHIADRTWIQAALPVRYGGLGVRRVSEVALPAFLSSAHGCRTLFSRICAPFIGSGEVVHMAEAQERWRQLCPDQAIPTLLASQKRWDEPLCRRVQQNLLNSSPDAPDRARLLAVFEHESGLWLNALPSPNIGTLLDNTSLSLIVGLRLGAKIIQPHACRCGQAVVDQLGHHGLACKKSAGRIPRHALLNDVLRRALASANVPATLEPNGVVRSDGKRPDGVSHTAWKHGRFLAWDATCVDTLAPCHVATTAERVGAAAAGAEIRKANKYRDLHGGYMFVPLGFETMGPWGPETKNIIKDLSMRLVEASGDRRAGSFLGQRFSLAVQRGNAACLLGTMEPRKDALDAIFYL